MSLLAPSAVFLAAYTLHLGYITVFYHRALAHRAVSLRPGTLRFVLLTGNWVTGLDPKAWACMHRMHHAFSDGPHDPHSPAQAGVLGVLVAQLRAYERTLYALLGRHPDYLRHVRDLDFPVHWLNGRGLWWLPYALHTALAGIIGLAAGPWLGLAYGVGLMSHPLEGWVINSLGHAVGPRNFDTPDNSRNPWLAALLIYGEGLQNNHHRYPASARFAYRWWEPDLGFALCRLLEALGVLTIDRARLLPPAGMAEPTAQA